MRRVLLIHGDPEHGKTWLANKLSERGFHNLSVDKTYVEFVRKKCRELYFKELRLFIAPHFHGILSTDYAKNHLHRDYAAEWHKHLLDLVVRENTQHDGLAVEGYLLRFCLNELVAKLKLSPQVSVIEAINRNYRTNGSLLSLEEIVALASESLRAAPNASHETA